MPEGTGQEPQAIRDAITEAVRGSEFLKQLEDDADDLGLLGDTSAGDPAAEGEQSSTGDGPDGASSSEDPLAGVTDDELPDTYWGTSLEGLSAEQKREVISALEQRDSMIQQLQAKLAQPLEPEDLDQEEETVDDITDEDILRALDVDMNDPFAVENATKLALPLAKQLIQLEEQVEALSNTETVRTVATQWNAALDDLESQYGKLPGDRVEVLNFAAREGITNPEVLYFRLTAPSRQAVEAEVSRVRREAARKAAAGGVRPRAVDGGKRTLDTEGLSLRDTVRAAALQAQEETGKRWSDVLRQS